MQRSSGVIRFRLIFGAATLLGLFSTFQAYYYVSTFATVPSKESTFPHLLLLNFNYWYSWALVAPAVLWLARRFPLERATWTRSGPAHLAGVFAATLAHVTFVMVGRIGIEAIYGPTSRMTWLEEFQQMFFLYFDWEMMTYWTIVGLSHAVRYHYEAQSRALAASQLETRLIEAQLQTLQRQLQPHFLFNTLNTVSALMHRDVEAADTMLAQLGDLLRLSFETLDVQEVSLGQELAFLRKYVAIEQARFRERLHVTFDVAPGLDDCLVPNLLLQPLVENAIRHGIGPRVEPGHVIVRAARVGDTLELEVRDAGVGVPAAALADLAHGVGLSNTRSRLAHLYGDRHRFAVTRPPGGGLSVVIVIPVDELATEAGAADEMEGVA
ncbi:MAG: sensor histidine kinase [Acidobacteria bacterium]|nr:sensor histidine kinase [Acidobacteriota bacterium]